MAAPTLPAIQSLAGAALAMILKGQKVSHLDFQDSSRSYCLRDPIFKLRAAG
ncbi:hypothetical protein [Candidatus Methylobacter oryzae]|uniref:hypothetical protein n=1 Tax=Candidatus Methylobacter oryzae TaxID=2497749 RepID=UPI0012B52961|nr:hypothetical protein [Candidatus Methylobacter oryzae]